MRIVISIMGEERDVYSDFFREIREYPISDDLKECDESILEHNYNIVLEYLVSDFAYLINVLIFKRNKSYIAAARKLARTLQRGGYTLKNFSSLMRHYSIGAFEDFKPLCPPLTDIKMKRNEYMGTVFEECDRISPSVSDFEQNN